MFDISFTEMLIVAIAALVIIGPERLPKVARQAGNWVTKMRRYVDDVKSDFNKQIELSELRDLKKDVQDAARSIQGSVDGAVSDVKGSFDSVQQSLEGTPDSAATTASEPVTNWDEIYATRRTRERIKDRRIERERDRGFKRPRRPTFR
jgi:sec-independent protein translocase protein TatB